MIRPERIGIEPHAGAGGDQLPGIVERSVFLGGSHEVHIRVLGGELLKATVANDGTRARRSRSSRARRSACACRPTGCAC